MAWPRHALVGTVASFVCLVAIATGSADRDGQEPLQDPPSSSSGFIGNKSLKSFHRPDCPLIKRLTTKSKVEFTDADAAAAEGYRACTQCKPLEAAGETDSSQPADTKAAGDQARNPRNDDRSGAPDASAGDSPAGGDLGPLRFSRDIAPILAANCMDCHRADPKRGEFNLSTFEGLAIGSKSGAVIMPGKPEESLLVELVATRKMPRGNNRRLSDEAIAKIRQWVKQGAVLDPGVSPTDTLDKIIPTPEQQRSAELARLSPAERDQKLQDAAAERFRTAGAKETPPATSGRAFVLFGKLPEERAKNTLRALDTHRNALVGLFGPKTPVLGGLEKISLYVFTDANSYAEFVRSVEQREIESGVVAHARLSVESPYLAAIDPLHGTEEPSAPRGRVTKAKAAERDLEGPERSLAGLLSEQLGSGVIAAFGACPRWLADGFGAYLAAQVEPRSFYFTRLRREVAQQLQLGWTTKVTEALGDQGRPEVLRAVGFSLCEWMGSAYRGQFPYFVQGVASQGGPRLDATIQNCFSGANREQFLEYWAAFVATRYGSARRR